MTKLGLSKSFSFPKGFELGSFQSMIQKNTVEAKKYLGNTLNTNFNMTLKNVDSCQSLHGQTHGNPNHQWSPHWMEYSLIIDLVE